VVFGSVGASAAASASAQTFSCARASATDRVGLVVSRVLRVSGVSVALDQ
jgi:hypothetical protein